MNYKKYVYSSYWRTWSRVLECKDGCFVEVNLTAINPKDASEWERNSSIIIRRHRTSQCGNSFSDIIPMYALAELESHMSEDVVQRLLYEDFLPQIDWDRYNAYNNGGAEFELIRKEKKKK